MGLFELFSYTYVKLHCAWTVLDLSQISQYIWINKYVYKFCWQIAHFSLAFVEDNYPKLYFIRIFESWYRFCCNATPNYTDSYTLPAHLSHSTYSTHRPFWHAISHTDLQLLQSHPHNKTAFHKLWYTYHETERNVVHCYLLRCMTTETGPTFVLNSADASFCGFVTSHNTMYQLAANHRFTHAAPIHVRNVCLWPAVRTTNITEPILAVFAKTHRQYFLISCLFPTQPVCCQQHSATANSANSCKYCVKRGTADRTATNGLWPPRSSIRVRFVFPISLCICQTYHFKTKGLCNNKNVYKLSNLYKIMTGLDVDIKMNNFLYNFEKIVCREEWNWLMKFQ